MNDKGMRMRYISLANCAGVAAVAITLAAEPACAAGITPGVEKLNAQKAEQDFITRVAGNASLLGRADFAFRNFKDLFQSDEPEVGGLSADVVAPAVFGSEIGAGNGTGMNIHGTVAAPHGRALTQGGLRTHAGPGAGSAPGGTGAIAAGGGGAVVIEDPLIDVAMDITPLETDVEVAGGADMAHEETRVTAVPLPAAFWAGLLGLAGVGLLTRRRRGSCGPRY